MKSSKRKWSLAVTVICFNEEDRIRDCLESVVDWADQIIVLDSGSTDKTVDLATPLATELYVTDWPGYGVQRVRALDKVKCDYVLSLDADEAVTPELKAEIDYELNSNNDPCAVYRIPWIPIFLGRRLKHGRYASPQARLFRKEGAQYPTAQIHETLMFPEGKIGFLKGGLLHNSFRDYGHCMEKHNQYAWLLAKEKQARGDKASIPFAAIRAVWEFIHQYFFRKLLLDGAEGYLMAIVLAQYAFNKYAGLWALNRTKTPVDARFLPHHRERRADDSQGINMDNAVRIK